MAMKNSSVLQLAGSIWNPEDVRVDVGPVQLCPLDVIHFIQVHPDETTAPLTSQIKTGILEIA